MVSESGHGCPGSRHSFICRSGGREATRRRMRAKTHGLGVRARMSGLSSLVHLPFWRSRSDSPPDEGEDTWSRSPGTDVRALVTRSSAVLAVAKRLAAG